MKKKMQTMLSAAACAALALSAVPFSAAAADDVVYGTMEIPYADFFAAEFADAANSNVEVDAVSSATTSKWAMSDTGSVDAEGNWKNGGLAAGTYNEPGENGGGTILGVVYPVAISQADLDALGENNYNFTALDTTPVAYKEVTVTNGEASFSKLVDTDGVQNVGGSVTLQTQTQYGDYQIAVENYPKDADTYAAIVKTADNNYYAMRSLENIWRNGSYAWSVGYVTEVHGNNIDNPDYYGTNGATISEVVMITLDGYRVVSDVNLYLPVIFTKNVSVENAAAGTGSTTFDASSFPTDFAQSGAVADGFTVSGNTISYENAKPGSYTLTVSDTAGKYANVTGSFTLSTAEVPVKYEDGKLVAADGYTNEDVANYLANINAVTVGEKTYKPGRRGVTVIDAETGAVLFDAASGETPVFDGSGEYTITVAATGYTTDYTFSTAAAQEPTTDAAETTSGASTTAPTTASTTAAGTTAAGTTGGTATGSPQTGDTSALPLAVAAAAAAGLGLAVTRRKNR